VRLAVTPGVLGTHHAGIEEQPAVAVLGQAGQRVEAVTRSPAISSGSISE
jgi:hypothetical protein